MITQERLKEVLDYHQHTGIFVWKISTARRVKVGDVAGYEAKVSPKYSRLMIRVDGRLYKAHRLAWFYMTGIWPKGDIDHQDGNPLNNRFNNLREATRSENLRNADIRRNNTSGYKGVCWNKRRGKWMSGIGHKGKNLHLGYFTDKRDAAQAYNFAAARLHGEFARMNE